MMDRDPGRPRLSVVVAVYNMCREAPRTIHSLSTQYQINVHAADYEVLVVENGSSLPLDPAEVTRHGPQFHYHYHATRSPSPVRAINDAVRRARGELVAICIDGARMFSPGVLSAILEASRLHDQPVITPLAWHLGPDIQPRSIITGYNQTVEDQLLDNIGWPRDGYRLFDIAVLAGASARGYFRPLPESSCLVMRRALCEELGGFDEGFDLVGGGLANHDLYRRACEHPSTRLIVLLGEGTFHQIHGGTSSNAGPERAAKQWQSFLDQYQALRGRPFERPTKAAVCYGTTTPASLRFLKHSCAEALGENQPAVKRSWFSWLKSRAA